MNGGAWTALSAIVVALITTIGLYYRSRKRPGRDDVTVTQLWDENRKLRDDLNAVSDKVDGLIRDRDAQHNAVRILGDGFDALSAVVERTSPPPTITSGEHAAIERAKQLLGDDAIWATGRPHRT